MSDDRFLFQKEPAGLVAALRELTADYPCSPKLWQDAYLAAFAIAAQFRLITFDSGFQKFKGLECLVLTPK